MARTRVFDVDKAIDIAMNLFWRNGYDRTSLADLTGAMGITPPSFYFAFQSKEGLFERVVDRYLSQRQGFTQEALLAPTAREVVRRLLHGYASLHTDPAHPRGCLGVNCALPCPEDADRVRMMLSDKRSVMRKRLKKRFDRAKADGDLPEHADTAALARFVQVVGYGMSVEAQSGASRGDLRRAADLALDAWPSGTKGRAERTLKGPSQSGSRRPFKRRAKDRSGATGVLD